MDCMGTCVSADMPPDGEAALRLAAARLQATGPSIPTANLMFLMVWESGIDGEFAPADSMIY